MEDALYWAKQIQKGAISAEELFLETIKKIENINPQLNAVVRTRYDKALYEIQTRPLSKTMYKGVPILLKDLGQNLKGELNTCGSSLLQNNVSNHTDNLVKKIEELGFIVIGQTNAAEFGFTNFTDNMLYGTTRNPVDMTRHAGGSSGGAASTVSGDMIPLALASDGGGSIRIPASWTGTIGLKPSRGRIPVGPFSYRGWQGASVHFAITKSVRDTKALFYALQTEQWESPFTLPLNKELPMIKPLKIAYSTKSPVGTPVSDAAKNAVYYTVQMLKELGCIVEEATPKLDGIGLMQSYYMMNSAETAAMFHDMEMSLKRPLTREDMNIMAWIIYQSGKDLLASDYTKALSCWDSAAAVMTDFHEEYDVFLQPSTADVAPKLTEYGIQHKLFEKMANDVESTTSTKRKLDIVWEMFLKGLTLTPFTQQANLTGQPAISLPIYQTKNGLPLGVQLTARKGREDILFALSEQLEPYFLS
ncbi:amidase [Carnobacteriaceae bacterium zg-ZUI78]|nr:amidase [Carnobacteriaceae bacterium zg-ZUI78]